MKKLKEGAGSLIMSLCEIVIGILLLLSPIKFTVFVFIVLGIVLVIRSVVNIVSYFRTEPEAAAKERKLSGGLICLIIGLFCIFRSEWFITMIPALIIFYGIIMLVAGVMKLQWTVDAVRLKKKQWLFDLISAALSLVCAWIIILNPFTSTAILWMFAAISLIAAAVLDLIAVFTGGRKTAEEEN